MCSHNNKKINLYDIYENSYTVTCAWCGVELWFSESEAIHINRDKDLPGKLAGAVRCPDCGRIIAFDEKAQTTNIVTEKLSM